MTPFDDELKVENVAKASANETRISVRYMRVDKSDGKTHFNSPNRI